MNDNLSVRIYEQLADAGFAPKNTPMPPLSDLIFDLVVAARDADAMTAGDKTASWTQRRLSRQMLGLTFMLALAIEGGNGPGSSGTLSAL